MSVLIGGVLLAAGVMLFILEPVFSGRSAPLYDGDDDYDEGAARRRVALTALRDLEYDFATGKLDERDYGHLKTELSHEALRHLEPREGEDGDGGGPPADRASRDLEEEIARLRKAIREGMRCAACEHVNRLGARFCGRCGGGLGVEAEGKAGVAGAGTRDRPASTARRRGSIGDPPTEGAGRAGPGRPEGRMGGRA